MKNSVQKTDLVAVSLEGWNSSFRRTSQIMSRFARYRRVFFFEPAIFGVAQTPLYLLRETRDDVVVVEPYLPSGLSASQQKEALQTIIRKFMLDEKVTDYTLWTDTPKVVPLIRDLKPSAFIYDCVEDYSQTHAELEREIFELADLVFTSCNSLYTAKRNYHSNIHNNPDSLDYRHFYQARYLDEEPVDQQWIPHPRVGFSGTIDHKIDFELLQNLAEMRPDIQFILLGDIKIPQESLPKVANIHFLGSKSYSKLPLYMAGWDCSFLPYKASEETQYFNPSFISESLVGGRPVVSTPMKDVVKVYDGQNLIHLAEFPIDFERALQSALEEKSSALWMHSVDQQFKGSSWERGCMRLAALEKDIYSIKAQVKFPQTIRQLFLNENSAVPAKVG